MKMASLLASLALLLGALLPQAAQAAGKGHDENWCADAVDFAMRTAEYRNYGRTREFADASIHKDQRVFRQQYPSLSERDMRGIAMSVYDKNWSHFGAASEMSKTCSRRAEKEVPAVFSVDHSDEWCANAVDFAMGVAQNRELAFTKEMITGSFDQNPVYYSKQFPELSKDEMLGITEAAYQRRWTRFGAAASVTSACRAAAPQKL